MSFLAKKDEEDRTVVENKSTIQLELVSEMPPPPPPEERCLGEYQKGFDLAKDMKLVRQQELRKMAAKGYFPVLRSRFRHAMEMKDAYCDEVALTALELGDYLDVIPDDTLEKIKEANLSGLFRNMYIIRPRHIRSYYHLVIGEYIIPEVDDKVNFEYSIWSRDTLVFLIDRFC